MASQAPLSLASHRLLMKTTTDPPQGTRPAGLVTLGSGWVWPAAFVALIVGLFYVPGHNPSSGAGDDLIGTIGVLYVIGLSVTGVRLLRGIILRAGGSREPIVLLGRAPDPLNSATIKPHWRLGAVVAGAVVPVTMAIAAAQVVAGVGPGTNAHAIANLALGVNAVIAIGVLVPAPGFPGWALLLAVVDAAGARPDQRIRRTSRLAQSAGLLILAVAAIGAALLGHPMLMFLGFALGFVAWSGSQTAAAQDETVRFLAAHTAGEIARPMMNRSAPDEAIGDIVPRLRTEEAVLAVESGGGVIGAIGPRQLKARGTRKRDDRCADAMVPLASLRLVGPATPAVELLSEVARHGFALVTGPDELGYVEAADLGRQIGIWVALGDARSGADSKRRRGEHALGPVDAARPRNEP